MNPDALPSEAHRRIAALVAELGPGPVERRLTLADGTVRRWLAHGAMPQPRVRERVREVYGIPVEAWAAAGGAGVPIERPTPTVAKGETMPPRPRAPVPADSNDPIANAIATLGILRARLETLDPGEVAALTKVANAITSSSRLLARLTGALEVTEAQIVRSAPFRRAIGIMQGALVNHPAAARDVAKAFEGYGT